MIRRALAPALVLLCLAHPAIAAPADPHAKHHHHHSAAKAPEPARTEPRHAAPTQETAKPAPTPATPPPPPPDLTIGSETKMKLPRFASLKMDEVNLRSGPNLRSPIEWVFKRHDLPVQIEREFQLWRQISDQDGVRGWVHGAALTGRRTFVVTTTARTIRSDPKEDADPVAVVKPGVIGRIRSCEANADWCQVQVGDYRGWLKRDAFWGSYPGEAIR